MLSAIFKGNSGNGLMVNFFNKRCIFLTLFVFNFCIAFSQTEKPTLGFYKVISDSSDLATVKMTQELFYSQISSLNKFTITDHRDIEFKENDFFPETIAFYSQISEKNDIWTCTLNIVNSLNSNKLSDTRTYDSYYKILTEAKFFINQLFGELKLTSDAQLIDNTETQNYTQEINVETLAGTWKGEDFIDKIIILRGGRGFVIFKNGASMNISLTIENNKVIAKQTSKTNASYFPDIPRPNALEIAPKASPIKYEFNLKDINTLIGNKLTLGFQNNAASEVIRSVQWNRQ